MLNRRTQPVVPDMPAFGVYIAESHHAADFQMNEQVFPFHVIAYILHGRGRWTSAGRSERCREGDVVAAPIGHPYHFADDPGHAMSLYVLCVDKAVGDVAAVGPLPRNDLVARHVRETMRLLLFEQTRQHPAHAPMIRGLTLQLLARLERFTAAANPTTVTSEDRVAAYAEMMKQTFFLPANIDTAAAELNLSRRRFTQLFKQITGDTWLNHLHAIRIDHARKLLRETNRTVIAIAFECGYEDLSSFYRAFQRAEKVSPNRWRFREPPRRQGRKDK